MPRKPKRPCSYPGCPNLTDGRFCPEHEKKETKRYEKSPGNGRGVSRTKLQFQTGYIGP